MSPYKNPEEKAGQVGPGRPCHTCPQRVGVSLTAAAPQHHPTQSLPHAGQALGKRGSAGWKLKMTVLMLL